MAKKKPVTRTPEERQRLIGQVNELINKDTPVAEAVKQVGISASNWYQWQRKKGKPKTSKTKIVTHSGEVKKTKRRNPKTGVEQESGDVYLVLGNPEQVARFYKSLQR